MAYVNIAANLGDIKKSGDTTDYATVYTAKSGAGAVIAFVNTHTATTMQYKVNLYLSNEPSAQAYPIIPETTLEPSTYVLDSTSITLPFAKLDILVKHTSSGGSYQVDVLKY